MKKETKKTQKKGQRRKRNKQRKHTIISACILALISIISIIVGIVAIIVALSATPEQPVQNIEITIEKIEIYVPENKTSNIDIPMSEEQETEENPTISGEGPDDKYFYHITETEKILLTKLVYQEARGESEEGKVAVVATVFNRLFYKGNDYVFDNSSLESIIRQAGQYASIEGVTVEMLEKVPECREAVEAACKGWDPTRKKFKDGAKFFYAHNSDLISEEELNRRKGVEKLVIDNHTFHDSFNSEF